MWRRVPWIFRKGHDGLAAAVQEMFGLDPFGGAAFVFRSKRADRIKILVWDRTGLVLVHKRLEGSRFVWPQVRDGVMRMSPAQFAALFEGLDWRLVRPEGSRRPQLAGWLRQSDSGACSRWRRRCSCACKGTWTSRLSPRKTPR